MFYSQFILAKKGPLGTIWVAAHLERKLRKNQVADTDIGVSVDSILSPDVPIALRLSSHLLLGVVRIYSRKVNYLFDDSSDALLKVKQAFRSAAVDLPPEESKAPYNSITLPETFDLDDFELPENDIIQGNLVDHHISSREQITLQDNIDGSGYSTSKFGLDERFGDGDAFGLDLNEELFLDKIGSAGEATERSDPQASVGTATALKQDEHPETSGIGVDGGDDDHGGGDDYADPMDYAHTPSTPGLVEEPNLSNAQEVAHRLERECPLVESIMNESVKNNNYEDKQEVNWSSHNKANSDAIPMLLTEENGHQSDDLNINLSKELGESPIEANLEHLSVDESSLVANPVSDLSLNLDLELAGKINESLGVDKSNTEIVLEKSAGEIVSVKDYGSLGLQVPNEVKIVSNEDKSCPDVLDLVSKNHDGSLNFDVNEKVVLPGHLFLRPCNSSVGKPDITSGCVMSNDADVQYDFAALETSGREETVMLGKQSSTVDDSIETLKGNHIQEHGSREDIYASFSGPDSRLHTSNSHVEIMNNSAEANLPAPEKLLSVPEGHVDLHGNILVEVTPKDIHAAFSGPHSWLHTSNSHVEIMNNSAEANLPAPEKPLSVPEGHVDLHGNILVEVSPKAFIGLDESDAVSKIISGKKRSCTESTLTEQSLNSVEFSRVTHFRRTVESVPDGNDLLSSILVGSSSVLKVRPTPRLSVSSMKRKRSALNSGSRKRKVLMDDAMVLHGDTIRQQLTNIEDIRRARKKAPCTRPEISIIQRHCLEDEIFHKPILTGMSLELIQLHSQTCDLSRITIVKNDPNGAFREPAVELRFSYENDENANSLEPIAKPMLAPHDVKNDHSCTTASEPYSTFQNDEVKEADEINEEINISREQTEPTADADIPIDVTEVQTSEKNVNTLNSSHIAKLEPLYLNGDAASARLVQPDPITETIDINTSVNADTSAVLDDEKTNVPLVELDSAVMDVDNGQAISKNELSTVHDGEINNGVENEPDARDEALPEVPEEGSTVEIGNVLRGEQVSMADGFMNNGENPKQPELYHQYMTDPITETIDINTSVNADTSAVLDGEKTDVPLIELDSAVMDVDNGQAISKNELSTVHDGDINNGVENEPDARNAVLPEVPEDGSTVEIRGVLRDEQFLMVDGFMNNGENPKQPELYQQYMMDPINETTDTNTYVNADTSAVLDGEKTDVPLIELDSAVMDVDNGQAISKNELSTVHDGDITNGVENEPDARDDVLPEVPEDGSTVEIRSVLRSEQVFMVAGSMNNGENPKQPELYQQYMMDPINETIDMNTSVNADTSAVLDDEKTDVPLIELDSAVMDVDNGQAISKNELSTVHDGDINNGVENEPDARDDLPEVPEDGATVEIRSVLPGEQFLVVDGFMNNGENPKQPDLYQRYMMDPETSGFGMHDQEELKYSTAGNDTEFLNVDDEDLNEIADDHIHDDDDDDDDESRFTENTGWSSRTRAVSKYLQTLFVKEAEFGRKSLSMDKLLIGKSRKEASRMFFEALVLKTRDYIHVEQHNPFDDITMKPRTRLVKSDF